MDAECFYEYNFGQSTIICFITSVHKPSFQRNYGKNVIVESTTVANIRRG